MNWRWMIVAVASVGLLSSCDTERTRERVATPPTANVPGDRAEGGTLSPGEDREVAPSRIGPEGVEERAVADDPLGSTNQEGLAQGEGGTAAQPASPTPGVGEQAERRDGQERATVVTLSSTSSFDEVTDRLENAVDGMEGYELRKSVDHEEVAGDEGVELGKSAVFTVSNPTLTAPLLRLSPTMGLELPVRILVYEQGGETHLTYHDPRAFSISHGVSEMDGNIVSLGAAVESIARQATGDAAVLGEAGAREMPKIAPSSDFPNEDEEGVPMQKPVGETEPETAEY